jgi:hypothetical protein
MHDRFGTKAAFYSAGGTGIAGLEEATGRSVAGSGERTLTSALKSEQGDPAHRGTCVLGFDRGASPPIPGPACAAGTGWVIGGPGMAQ